MGKRAAPLPEKGKVVQHKEKWRVTIWLGGKECTPARDTEEAAQADLQRLRGCASEEAARTMARQIHEDGGDDVATDRPKTLWRPDKTLLPSRGRETKPR